MRPGDSQSHRRTAGRTGSLHNESQLLLPGRLLLTVMTREDGPLRKWSILVPMAVPWNAGLSCEKLAWTPARVDFCPVAWMSMCEEGISPRPSSLSAPRPPSCPRPAAAGFAGGGPPPALPVPTPGTDSRCFLLNQDSNSSSSSRCEFPIVLRKVGNAAQRAVCRLVRPEHKGVVPGSTTFPD